MTDYFTLSEEEQLKAAQIIHDCYIEKPYNYDWEIENIRRYFRTMKKKGYCVNVYEIGTEPVGVCVSIRTNNEGLYNLKVLKSQEIPEYDALWYIQDICVSPSAQRRGVGKRMMEWFTSPLVLFTYVDAPAVEFYRTLGMTPIKSLDVKNRLYFIQQ